MTWRKSAYSGSGGENCVEVGTADGTVGVRDTKQAALGSARTVLTVAPDVWRAFAKSVK